MFFEIPNIKYTDMCIYIDENIYKDEFDSELIYQYLYHLCHMFSIKRNYFNTVVLNDDFALYAASKYYMRLTNPCQFGDNKTLEPVKSILNYIKKTLYGIRADFYKEYSYEVPVDDNIEIDKLDNFRCSINRAIDELYKCEFEFDLSLTHKYVHNFLKHIPYREGTTIWNNIYISCLLSILNSITIPNRDIKRLKTLKRTSNINDTVINHIYNQQLDNHVILFHLDENMYDYIKVLVNRIRHMLSVELSQTLHSYVPTYVNEINIIKNDIGEED